jgi:FAD:protein FMN transferase
MITTWRGMGTRLEVHTGSAADADRARSVFEDAERRFSRFLPDSELSVLNTAGRGRHRISSDMREVLGLAEDLRHRTGGIVEPAVGGALIDWGYSRTFDAITEPDRPPRPRRPGTWSVVGNHVEIEGDVYLDLGGIVKGWTCDRVVDAGIATVASAGGDIRSADPDLVVHVLDGNDEAFTEVHLGIGAFATSSRVRRRWSVGSIDAHHLIDPRTMRPATTPVLSASVATETAVEAEAGAKGVLLQGAGGLAWADRQPWITFAMALWEDGSAYGTTLRRAS